MKPRPWDLETIREWVDSVEVCHTKLDRECYGTMFASLAALTAEVERLRGALEKVKETHYAHECSACFKIATIARAALDEGKGGTR